MSRKSTRADKKAGSKQGRRRPLLVESLEHRITPVGELAFTAVDSTALTLRMTGNDLQIVKTATPSVVLAARPLGEITSGVRVEGAGFNVGLTIDATVPPVGGGVRFVGGAGTNTLFGPNAPAEWILGGTDAGTVTRPSGVAVTFVGVENLRGGTGDDTFRVNAGGSVAGTITGGGGTDTLIGDDA